MQSYHRIERKKSTALGRQAQVIAINYRLLWITGVEQENGEIWASRVYY